MNHPTSTVSNEGDVWLSYHPVPVRMRFWSIARKGYKARCDIYVNDQTVELGEIDLLDLRQRETWASQLAVQHPRFFFDEGWDWRRAFVMATERMREYFAGPDRLIEASEIPYIEPPPPLINPIIDDTVNVWAGHGGALKSVLSVMAAYQISTGVPILGRADVHNRNSLILDYEEMDEQRFGHRYRLIRSIYPRPEGSSKLFYRNEFAPITDTADAIRRLCDENDIGFLVIDPLINARGGAAESSSDTQAAMDAIRSLRRPVLIIDHLKQDDGKGHGQDRPFGSVFTRNLARSVWTISRPEPDEGMAWKDERIEFTDRKANHRKIGEPIQMEVKWDDLGIRIKGMYQEGWPIHSEIWAEEPIVNSDALSAFDIVANGAQPANVVSINERGA